MAAGSLLTPGVAYADPESGLAWLQDVLGFSAGHIFRGPSGDLIFAELHWRSNALFVSGRAPGENPWSAVGVAAISLAVEDSATVDDIYQRAVESGADIVWPPFLSKTPLFPGGSHQFDVRDVEGHLWTVGTYRPTPESDEPDERSTLADGSTVPSSLAVNGPG